MHEHEPVRIAMWSGPRNISTAMMRAWENRADTFVIDEPFYAFYLHKTGAEHPAAEEVIAHGDTDWKRIVDQLTSGPPRGKRIFYQKQMSHHLLPEVDRTWLRAVTNCFLIRDPQDVLASYTRKNHEPAAEDLGFIQQADIFDAVHSITGTIPPVIDAADVLRDSRRTLHLLCKAVGVEFTDAMLSWPPGRRSTDGVWAKHWYAEVERSTGFWPFQQRNRQVPAKLRDVYDCCQSIYERLRAKRLQ